AQSTGTSVAWLHPPRGWAFRFGLVSSSRWPLSIDPGSRRPGCSVHQRPPQPLERAEAIPAQPPHAEDELRRVERHAEGERGCRAHPAKLPQSVAEKDEAENHRLQHV